MAMFWGLFQRNLGELPEKTIPPRLTLQREIWREKKFCFIIVSVYMRGAQGKIVRNGKFTNGRVIQFFKNVLLLSLS